MNLQLLPILLGVLSGLIPVVATILRGRSRTLTLFVILATVSVSAYLLILRQLVIIGPTDLLNGWVYALVASATPMLLAGFLLSFGIGREDPKPVGASKKAFVGFGVIGAIFVAMVRHDAFVSGYGWGDSRGTILLGPLGKAYLSYLLVGIVWIGFNLESTYRFAPSDVRHQLKLPFFGFFAGLVYLMFVLSTGLLYSSLGLGKLVASGLPVALANVVVGYGFLRGALTDVAAPVSRHVVYSSFSALIVGLYVFSVGAVAQIATFTKWSPDEVLTVSFAFLAGLFVLLLMVSNRFQRRVRRFIDRNFYVNRYDYRTQWSNVTRAFDKALTTQEVLPSTSSILKEIFHADEITIAMRENVSTSIHPELGKGQDTEVTLEEDTPLYLRLSEERRSLMLDRSPHDLEYIPIYAENHKWLDATASQMVAPLFEGQDLVGSMGIERTESDERFTFEDLALLDSIASHVSSALLSARLAEELAESREMQLMSQWSSMILHDLKNYLAPLRLVAQNLLKYQDRKEVVVTAAADLNRVADRMQSFIGTLSELRDNPQVARDVLDVNALIEKTLTAMQVEQRSALQVKLDLQARIPVMGDEDLLRRVLENLVSNAIEAMPDKGTLAIRTGEVENGDGTSPGVEVSITDTGPGIPKEFLKTRLGRPFATTKRGGMGLGLYQCRTILRAHGGQLRFDSKSNGGTTVRVVLRASPPEPPDSLQAVSETKNGALL